MGEKAGLSIRKHDHYTPTREIERHVRALVHNLCGVWGLGPGVWGLRVVGYMVRRLYGLRFVLFTVYSL